MRVAQVGGTWATKRGGELHVVKTDVALASLGVVVGTKAVTLIADLRLPLGVRPAPASNLIPRDSAVGYDAGVRATRIIKARSIVVVIMTTDGVDDDVFDVDGHWLLLRVVGGFNNLEPDPDEGAALLTVLKRVEDSVQAGTAYDVVATVDIHTDTSFVDEKNDTVCGASAFYSFITSSSKVLQNLISRICKV